MADVFVLVRKGSHIHIARAINPRRTLCGKPAGEIIDHWRDEPWCIVCSCREEALINGTGGRRRANSSRSVTTTVPNP